MNKFIEAKSIIDSAEELRRKGMAEAADAVVKCMVARHNGENGRNPSKTSADIDKLLEHFSAEEKYEIMKVVFIKMC